MKFTQIIILSILLSAGWGCDKKNEDLIEPLTAESFPQVITFDDEGDGDLEDADEFSFKLTLNDRVDTSGEEPDGKIVPLTSDVTVLFEVTDWEGFSSIKEYIKDTRAFYEIDDCTTSEDQGINLNIVFDINTGKGSVRFPKNVTEVEVVFETDEDLLNDNLLNTEERAVSFAITGVQAAGNNVVYNKSAGFTYEVLDDEGISGDWELDHENTAAFTAFKNLFGLVNEDISTLDAGDVDKIEISIEYGEIKVIVELKETETITECGSMEEVNKVIELEAELEDLSELSDKGDIEFTGEVEQPSGSLKEFVYTGSFQVVSDNLELVLTGEYDDDETEEITLQLTK